MLEIIGMPKDKEDIIDMDKDISTDKNPQRWDNGVNNSPLNVNELRDQTKGHCKEEREIVAEEIEIDILWKELMRRESHNRNLLIKLRDLINEEGVLE